MKHQTDLEPPRSGNTFQTSIKAGLQVASPRQQEGVFPVNSELTNSRRVNFTLAGVIAILAASLALMVSGSSSEGVSHAQAHGKAMVTVSKNKSSVKQRNLYLGMRSLWSQHMEWTYAVVSAFVSDSPALQPSINRLLRNQKDIGNAIKPFYGKTAGNKLTALLTEHIQDAVPVLVAAKAGDTEALNQAVDVWYANAREIGKFLGSANPAWKGAQGMLKAHITGTVAYASDQLQGDYAKSIQDYDKAEAHMMMLADQLSAGIIKQFPRRFR